MAEVVVSGHQPAYLPWLGYFHKMILADVFVFMDDVQFDRQGFIHRNRIKGSGGESILLSVPIHKEDRYRVISEVRTGSQPWQRRHFESIRHAYRHAPFWDTHQSWLRKIYLERQWDHLADLCWEMLEYFRAQIGIDCRVVRESREDFTGKKSDLVLEHCLRYDATICLTGTMGREYIRYESFHDRGIRVVHQEYHHPQYPQQHGAFIPNMGIIDGLMNMPAEELYGLIQQGNLDRDLLRNSDACRDG